MSQPIEYQRPSPEEFRLTRYWIHRNRGESADKAGAAADRELAEWLKGQADTQAAEQLLVAA